MLVRFLKDKIITCLAIYAHISLSVDRPAVLQERIRLICPRFVCNLSCGDNLPVDLRFFPKTWMSNRYFLRNYRWNDYCICFVAETTLEPSSSPLPCNLLKMVVFQEKISFPYFKCSKQSFSQKTTIFKHLPVRQNVSVWFHLRRAQFWLITS